MSSTREDFKAVEISGRKWKIKKFDALTGSYVAYQLLMQALPMSGLSSVLGGLPKDRPLMAREDFLALQRDCLGLCFEMTTLNGVPVDMPALMQDGRWAVDGLEHDTATVMALTVHALSFNVSSFFEQMAQIFPKAIEKIKGLNSSATETPGEATPSLQ